MIRNTTFLLKSFGFIRKCFIKSLTAHLCDAFVQQKANMPPSVLRLTTAVCGPYFRFQTQNDPAVRGWFSVEFQHQDQLLHQALLQQAPRSPAPHQTPLQIQSTSTRARRCWIVTLTPSFSGSRKHLLVPEHDSPPPSATPTEQQAMWVKNNSVVLLQTPQSHHQA